MLALASPAAPAEGASKDREYRIEGRVLRSDQQPFSRIYAQVFLRAATVPYERHTLAGIDGRFTFKKVPPGPYILASYNRRAGEVTRSVVVGPGSADSKGKVRIDLVYQSSAQARRNVTVSAVELSVPDRARKELKKAKELLARRDVKGATGHLRKAVELAPQFTAAWNELGTLSYLDKQLPQAEKYFREALKQEPDSYPPLVNLAGTLYAMNRMEEALPLNQAAVKARPDDPLAQSQLGSTYYFLGQEERAEVHLQRAKGLDPDHFTCPQLLLAEIHIHRKQVPAAIAEMEDFLRRHPDSDWAPKVRRVIETLRPMMSLAP